MKYLFLVLGLFMGVPVFAQFDFTLNGGAKHLALGRATVAVDGTPGLYNNPAGLATISGFGGNISGLRRYNIEGLNHFSFGGVYGNGSNAVSLRLLQQGLEDYRETNIGISYAKKIDNRFDIGGSFNYYRISQLEFGESENISFDLGLMADFSENISFGFKFSNPIRQSIDDFHNLSSSFRAGFLYKISTNLGVLGEYEKLNGFDSIFKLGINYRTYETVEFLIGIIPTQSEYSFGFEYRLNEAFKLVGAFSYNLLFDVTPAIGFNYLQGEEN